jgi:hypothetical protein
MLVQHTNRGTESKENEMARTETTRKLREDLTPEQRERAARIGDLSFKSQGRDPYRMYVKVKYPGVGPKGRAA